MAKARAIISLNRAKAAAACALAGVDSISGVIDLALDRVI